MWGVRPDEAEGSSLFELDVGRPVEPLRLLVQWLFTGEGQPPTTVSLAAVSS